MDEFRIKENELRDLRLVSAISDNTGLTEEEAGEVVAYNIITIYQLAKISNRSVSAIQSGQRPPKPGAEPKLKTVFPFRFKDNEGPAFIEFDKSCYDYIISTHKPNAISHEKIPIT